MKATQKKAPVFIAGKIKRNTDLLIKRLESGKEKHTTGLLERLHPDTNKVVGRCCIGVACRMAKFKGERESYKTRFTAPSGVASTTGIVDAGWWKSMFGSISQDMLISLNDTSPDGYAPVIAHLKRVNARRK